jgi:hypothetical protein
VAVLERGLIHDLEASMDSAVLVTVSMGHRDQKPADSENPPAED